jgi:DNA-binding protein H-NS
VLDEVEREREKQALSESRKAEQAHRLARERALHVARQLVEVWRMEPRERTGRRPSRTRPDATPAGKYRHPGTGESWNGMGAQPEWLRRALGKEGYRVAELRADASTAAEDY